MRQTIVATVLAVILAIPTGSALAQGMYIYPAKGQSQAQQDKDRYECHSWAVQQTGFDPSKATATYSQSAPPQGGVVQGAAKGAVVGVVGGAIAGDAGKGAAIGAATGGLLGGMRRNNQIREQQYQNQQQANATAAQQNSYNRAMTACLTARGYSVD